MFKNTNLFEFFVLNLITLLPIVPRDGKTAAACQHPGITLLAYCIFLYLIESCHCSF